MQILITGSSGQIGTNLGLALIAAGHDVMGVDSRPNPWTDAFPTLVHDLLRPLPQLDGSSPQVAVHLAAHAKVHELVCRPEGALENVQMLFTLLEYSRSRGVPVVFASSREVYGDLPAGSVREEQASHASSASAYAASKIAGEAMVHAYARSYGLRYLIFRLSNVYGRYDNDLERMERVVPLWIRQIDRGELITVYGPEKTLDFTYVDDCVDGVMRGIEALAVGRVCDQTMNLAFGEGRKLLDVAELIAAALCKELRDILQPKRPGEITRYTANVDRARALLGYQPRVPLEAGIARAVAWTRKHAGEASPVR